ncbi:MAG: acyl-CoA dehydrogenase family protein, partial [Deltaproteobacteria bacterium]|nr:acyl-CoA dehydrogenase family protein [Deltaproteobacteria bacterium]
MDFRFTKEQEMLQKEIRRFAEEKLEPIAAEVDELDTVSWEVAKMLADATFMAAAVTAEDLETADVVSGAGPVDDTTSSGQDESTLTRLEQKRRIAAQQARVDFDLAMKRAAERAASANTEGDFQAA